MVEPILVTAREAARMLALNVHEVYDLCAGGALEKRYIGKGQRYFRIPVESVRAYADSLPRDPVGETA